MSGLNSTRLKENKEVIMALWTERSLKEVPSASTAETLALRNSLPLYLDHLSEALATNRKMDVRSVATHDEESIRLGKLHGADRAGSKSYILTEVIFEYHILREVIFQVLEKDEPLSSLQRDIILDSVEQAVNDAAVKFTEVHAEIQQKFDDTLTHDLKTPLTSAKMAAQLIQRNPEKTEANARSAGLIIAGLNRMESMIHNLLDASRVRAGEELSLPRASCDVVVILRGVIEEMTLVHGNRFKLDAMSPLECNCSADGVRRAVENLIGNAVKYGTELSPITVSGKKSASGGIELSVHNVGKEIPADQIPGLFQHFGRSKVATDGAKPGWGLGLTQVRGVVNAHQGKLRVESSSQAGTRFIIDLPCS